MLGFRFSFILRQEKTAIISVPDTISAHVKLIQGNNILREVVSNTIIRTKLHG